MIGQRTRLRENNDLPPPFCMMYELIPRKNMLTSMRNAIIFCGMTFRQSIHKLTTSNTDFLKKKKT